MSTQCTNEPIVCKRVGRRNVVADFSGGQLTSDGGVVLLGKVDEKLQLTERFAELFTDHRDPGAVEHELAALVRQRVYALAAGYEDLNDHDELRRDPLLAATVGKREPTGSDRRRMRDQGCPLAGKSTLNRLELTPADAGPESRYGKTVLDMDGAERFFAEHVVRSHRGTPDLIVLDFDATDDPLHGKQGGRHFNGHYKAYVYLPLYVFFGDELLLAKLRPGDVDGAAGTDEVLAWLVPMLRQRWAKARIVVRADSGFCRDRILSWCEEHGVDYVIGLAKNKVLKRKLKAPLERAAALHARTGRPARVFADLRYRTQRSWSRERRVVGKAEYTEGKANPRFVVTSLPRWGRHGWKAQRLYERFYCARGDMENRIKEQQLHLFADRTSTSELRANQIRLWFSSLAYVLMDALRREALADTDFAKAQCSTIRLKLLKIGAMVRVSARRVYVALASCYPYEATFRRVWRALEVLPCGPAWVPQQC